jgi:hypothetical protein
MKRSVAMMALVACAVAPLVAQAPPAGWKMRVDRSTSASDPDAAGTIKFVTMGAGFHATNPQAASYYNPANAAAGNYTVKATFNLVKPSSHTNYYGLVFGGNALDGATQEYLYFMVGQDGSFMVKHRAGDATHDVVARAANDAVKKPDATGKSSNALEVRVSASKIDFAVNGTVVASTPKSGMAAKTDGVYGLRVNHQLEVHIDGLAMSKS